MGRFDDDFHNLSSIYTIINEEDIARDKETPAMTRDEFNRFKNMALEARSQIILKTTRRDSTGRSSPELAFGKTLQKLGSPVILPQGHPDIDTMAVSSGRKDSEGNITERPRLYINAGFVKELYEENTNTESIKFVLLHEAFHIMNRTFQRQGERHHRLWNIATDYIMNRDLLLAGYTSPNLGCLTSNENGERTKPGDEKQFIDLSWMKNQLKDEYQDSDLMIDITNFTCEQVYDLINDKLDKMSEEDAQRVRRALEKIKEEMDKHPTNPQPSDSDDDGISGHSDAEGEGRGTGGEASGEGRETGGEASGEGRGQPGGSILDDIAGSVIKEIEEDGTDQEKKDLNDKTDEGSDNDREGPAPEGREGSSDAGGSGGGHQGVETSKLDAKTINCSTLKWRKTLKHFLRGETNILNKGRRSPHILDPRLLNARRKMIPLGSAKPEGGDTMKAIFIVDVSGSMDSYYKSIKEGIACLALEFLGKLDMQIVLIGSQAADPIIVQSSSRGSPDKIFKQLDQYWETAEAQAGGGGIAFTSERLNWMDEKVNTHNECRGAIDWLYHMGNDTSYKYIFVITDTGYTDVFGQNIPGEIEPSKKYESILKQLMEKQGKIITVLSTHHNINPPGDGFRTPPPDVRSVIEKYHTIAPFGTQPKPIRGQILSIDMSDQILPSKPSLY